MKRILCILVASAGLAWAQEKPILLPAAGSSSTPLNLELTVYLVSGLAQAQPSGKDDAPADLASTLQQLRGVFVYKSYKMIEAVTLRGRNFSASQVAGELPDASHYNFRYTNARIDAQSPHMVHLDALRLEITRSRINRTDNVALVSTDLDNKDGQKTVVGKSAVNGSDAMFLVIVPRVVE